MTIEWLGEEEVFFLNFEIDMQYICRAGMVVSFEYFR